MRPWGGGPWAPPWDPMELRARLVADVVEVPTRACHMMDRLLGSPPGSPGGRVVGSVRGGWLERSLVWGGVVLGRGDAATEEGAEEDASSSSDVTSCVHEEWDAWRVCAHVCMGGNMHLLVVCIAHVVVEGVCLSSGVCVCYKHVL